MQYQDFRLNKNTRVDLGEMNNLTQYKECTKCHQMKPLIAFHKNVSSKFGRRSYCKACQVDYYREFDQKRSEDKRRKWLKKKFGISLEEYNALLESQGGVCAACGSPEIQIDKKTNALYHLAIDHNHTTGKIRGLLCRGCNMAYGNLYEDTCHLIGLLKYHYRVQAQNEGEGEECL